MRCECQTTELQQALAVVSGVSIKHVSLPVLASVLLEVQGTTLKLRATNLHVGVEVRVPVQNSVDGVVAVEAAVLQRMVASLEAGGKVTIEQQKGVLHIESNRTTADLKILPHDDFPTLPYVTGEATMNLQPEVFLSAVKAVMYAAASSDIKPEISSVYLYGAEDQLVAVATDSFRLAEKRVQLDTGAEFPGVLVPVKNIGELVRIVGQLNETLQVKVSNHQISFEAPRVYCVSRVIEGSFPDYAQIIPKEEATQVVALKADVTNILKTTGVFSDALQKLQIRVDADSKEVFFKSSNEEVGTQESRLDASVQGEGVEMLINQRYLQDCLGAIGVDSMSFGCSTGKPIKIRGVGDTSFLYLIMPMRQ